jgi:L-arabinose isomerase
MKVGVLSRMCGMGDILVDDMAFYRNIGIEICNDTVGSVYSRMQDVSKAEIDAQIEKDHATFVMDPKLSYESHSEAVKMYLGLKRWLTDKGFGAFTAQFDIFGTTSAFISCRFTQPRSSWLTASVMRRRAISSAPRWSPPRICWATAVGISQKCT